MIRIPTVLFALAIGGEAYGDARFVAESQQENSLRKLVYAQASIDTLSESEMRRLVFYADRSIRALQLVVEADGSRSTDEQTSINNRFRASIARLADAGQRSGLSMDQVADFFTEFVFNHFGQSFIQRVSEVAGGLDFRTLFRNVSTATNPPTFHNDSGAEFLNALAAESASLESNPLNSVPTHNPPKPTPPQNANAAEIAVVNRVKAGGDIWELEVTVGDSLSQIASAIYGDSLSYMVIFEANRDIIADPNILDVGTVLRLPIPQSADGNS